MLLFLVSQVGDGGKDVACLEDSPGVDVTDLSAFRNTTVFPDSDITYQYVDPDHLTAVLTTEAALLAPVQSLPADVIGEVKKLSVYTTDQLNEILTRSSAVFVQVIAEVARQLNMLPPSGAIAGVYSRVDASFDVWKAPANVGLSSVEKPTVDNFSGDQKTLEFDIQGNAIISLTGQGVLVRGAKTLDANSLDWRYVCVRRTMIMIEQSIQLAMKAYVFAANDSATWLTVKSMIRNFLTSVWQRGGLAGAEPDDAFSVSCGLRETMTANDILQGIVRVTILVPPIGATEFIDITFQQQMQTT